MGVLGCTFPSDEMKDGSPLSDWPILACVVEAKLHATVPKLEIESWTALDGYVYRWHLLSGQ
jgi:hypothetical protein